MYAGAVDARADCFSLLEAGSFVPCSFSLDLSIPRQTPVAFRAIIVSPSSLTIRTSQRQLHSNVDNNDNRNKKKKKRSFSSFLRKLRRPKDAAVEVNAAVADPAAPSEEGTYQMLACLAGSMGSIVPQF